MSKPEKVTLCSGEEYEIFEGDNRRDLQQLNEWSKHGFIKSVSGSLLLSKDYIEVDKLVHNLPYRSTDVFVNGYPKSGTTWIQEIVWTILHNADQNNPMKSVHPILRVPTLELDGFWRVHGEWLPEAFAAVYGRTAKPLLVEMFDSLPNPRVFKTHARPSYINKDMINISKVVYVIRNPLDSFLSFFLFHGYFTHMYGRANELEGFTDNYIKGDVFTGNAADHILSWWPYRGNKNVYFVFYEQFTKDPIGETRKLSKFLGKDLTDEQIQSVVSHTSFQAMKDMLRPAEEAFHKKYNLDVTKVQDSFFRKGKVGSSKELPDEIYNKLVAFFQLRLKDINLDYKFNPK